MGKIIAISNQKGGVGKTTTAINLGASLAVAEKRTLVLDIDPQGNATSGLGVEARASRPTIYSVLIGQHEMAEAVVKRKKQGYGRWRNFGIGLAGAAIGGIIHKVVSFDFGLGGITVSAADLVWALLGSFLLLFIIWIIQKKRAGNSAP